MKLLASIPVTLLAGCMALEGAGSIDSVKNGTLAYDRSRTIETVMAHYKYFSSHDWKQTEDEQGRELVVLSGRFKYGGPEKCVVQASSGRIISLEHCSAEGEETISFAISAADDSVEAHSAYIKAVARGAKGETIDMSVNVVPELVLARLYRNEAPVPLLPAT